MVVRGRVALVIVDGIGDVSVPSFDGRTPLQVAHTPHMDAIAAAGANGLMDPVEPGLACGSDTSHMALLGYDPRRHYRGRGAFEALGAGLSVGEGDVAFKCNFATLLLDAEASDKPPANIVLRRRADRDFEREGPVLCAALDGLRLDQGRFPGYGVEVRYATEHRCGVVVRGPHGGWGSLSDAITGTDPLRDGLPLLRCEPVPDLAEEGEGERAARTAATAAAAAAATTTEADDDERRRQRRQKQQQFTCDLVNHVSDRMREVLASHPINAERLAQGKPPANVVLLRGAGARLTGLPAFLGAGQAAAAAAAPGPLRACMVAPTKIIAGVGITFGLDVLPVSGATGDYRSDLAAKAAAVAAALDPLASASASASSSSSSSPSSSYDFALLHVKAVDDAGHDRAVALKVRLLEAVDAMIGQLLARLRAAERAQEARWRARRRQGGDQSDDDDSDDDPRCVYAVCVTGDHSTPVVFGDHSHEPVPFAVARVCDAVAALRGREDDEEGEEDDDNDNATAVPTPSYPSIPMPDPHAPPPPAAEMLRQLRQQEARHAAAAKGEAFPGKGGGGGGGEDAGGDATPFGPWLEPWPSVARARYDDALRFDEVTAGAMGGLGRFPGSEVMRLLAPFLGAR